MSDETNDSQRDVDNVTSMDRARTRLEEARQRFQGVTGELGDHVRNATERARSRGARISRHGAAIGRRALSGVSQVSERYGDQAEPLRQGYDQARDHVEGWTDDLSDYVREHPSRAVMAAVALGFVVGFLTRRRDEGGSDV